MYHVFIKNDKTIYTTFIFNLLQICNVSKHLIRIFFCSYGTWCNGRSFTELGVIKLGRPMQAAWAKTRTVKVIFWYGVERDIKRNKFTHRATGNHNKKKYLQLNFEAWTSLLNPMYNVHVN